MSRHPLFLRRLPSHRSPAPSTWSVFIAPLAMLMVLVWALLLPGAALGAQGGKGPSPTQTVPPGQTTQAGAGTPVAHKAEGGGRRLVVVEGMDYYGQDLETRQDIDLEACQSACLADQRCQAFTYNRKARWCFLKSDYEDARPFANAVSGHIAMGGIGKPNQDQDRRIRRLADLNFLPRSELEAARRQAAEIAGRPRPTGVRFDQLLASGQEAERAQDWPAAIGRYSEALRLTPDAPAAWLGLARASLSYDLDEWQARQRLLTAATAAASNAYLSAGGDADRVRALSMLGQTLAVRYQWRPALRALRAALTIQEDAGVRATYAQWLAEHGFRVTGHRVDSEAASPRICVEFSDPLAKERAGLTDFLHVETGRGLTVEADPQALCVDGVVHGERYRLRVRAGLPAADGEVLAQAADLDIYVRDRSPAVRFQGRAYVLPKGGEAAIPLVSVNTRLVKAQVLRLGDRSLATAAGAGPLLRSLSPYETQEIRDRQGEAIWSGEVEVGMELNRELTTAVPIGALIQELKPGAYVMTARPAEAPEQGDELATQWFVVSDLGLSGLTGNDGLHAFVRSLSSAQPLAGAKLRLVARNDEILGQASTDAAGHARFEPGLLRGEGGNKPALLIAEGPEGDFAFLDLAQSPFDLSDRGVAGRPAPGPVDVFLTTERGVYRAGERVQLTALARDGAARALTGTPLTLKLRRPDGVEHSRAQLPDQGLGGRHLAIDLPPTAMRGTWRAAVHADPEAPPLAEQPFLVEDFEPERLAFEPRLEATALDPAALPDLQLEARFLFGAPAAGLEVEGEVRLEQTDRLTAWPGYRFGLADEASNPVGTALPPTRTDAAGQARLALELPTLTGGSKPSLARVAVRVLEGGGRPVERTLERPVLDGRPRLGVKPLFEGAVEEGGTAAFEVIALDPQGRLLALSGLRWTLSRVTTSFQWYQYDGRWDYEPVTRRERVASGDLNLSAGSPGRIQAPVGWGGYELLVSPPSAAAGAGASAGSGGASAARAPGMGLSAGASPAPAGGQEESTGVMAASSVGVSSGTQALIPASLTFEAGWYLAPKDIDTPDLLKVSLDKPGYGVGEKARAHLEARFPGTALVLALGDRLLTLQEVQVPAGGTTVEIPVTADWGAGAYVTALLYRPMDLVAKRMPGRAIGLAWAAVNPGERQLRVEVTPTGPVAPRQPLELELSVPGLPAGAEAFVTLAAVDVGILNLTRFAPPDPDAWYFGQRRLGMEIRDLYGQLIDRMQGAPGVVRSGGDGGLVRLEGPPPTEDLLAFHSGILRLDDQGKARVRFSPSEFNGTIKLMAMAWTATGVGQAAQDLVMRDPIVIQASLPRFLAPGDESRALLELTHVSGPAGRVAISLETGSDQPVEVLAQAAQQELELTAGGSARIEVPLRALASGDAILRARLRTPDGQEIVKRLRLPVRDNRPAQRLTQVETLKPGGPGLVLSPVLFQDLQPDSAALLVSASGAGRLDLPGLLLSLDRYPYGCAEQVASRALPLLYVDQIALAAGLSGDLTGGPGGDLGGMGGARGGGQGRGPSDTASRIQAAITDLIGKQGSDGGFGLWGPGGDDFWLDAYVTDFLTRAREAGHAVPQVAFELALDNLRNRLAYAADFGGGDSDGGGDVYGQDFGGTGSAGGAKDAVGAEGEGYVNDSDEGAGGAGYINENGEGADADPTGALVGSFQGPGARAGGEDVAYALYVLARNARAVIGDLRYYAEAKLNAFATPLARAQLGAALALYGDRPRADRAFASALALLNRGEPGLGWRRDYGSDLRDAAALLALAAESGTQAVDLKALAEHIDHLGALDDRLSTQEQAWLLVAAQALMQGAAKPRLEVDGGLTEGPFFRHFTARELATGPATLINRGPRPLEVLVSLAGIPRLAPPPGGQGYRIERAWYDQEGRRVQPDRLTQGQRLVAILTVTAEAPGAARLLVDDPLPAGLEIENPSLLRAADLQGIPWLGLLEGSAHQEFRADRFVAAVDRQADDPAQFQLAYRLRAVTPGRFLLPAATVEDMYRPRQRAWTAEGRVEVMPGR
ncbi:MAG: alpha-2-macroglobulin [Gammaproteobacteria bacterium]|jgi:uncharacterized protein YfaS (alpha-2-macroglobulin family)|nr:alpha-2-macroglobulin [Gammaproteobacteria bacterium]